MNIAILGAGALGSAIGASLALAGQSVELWDINDAHMDAINRNGLIFDGPRGRETVTIPACRPEDGRSADVIILLTKTLHSVAALRGVNDKIDTGAMVLTAQNGLGNAEAVAQIVPADQVLYGCTMMPALFVAPGHVARPDQWSDCFRCSDRSRRKKAQAFVLDSDPIRLDYDPLSVDQIIWQKAAFNCALNSICALYDGPMSLLAGSADGVQLARDVAAEVVAVANAQGVKADLQAIFDHIERALAKNDKHLPSMQQDMRAGRPTEIDSLCGEVVRQGGLCQMPTPLNKVLATLVHLKSASVIGGNA